MKYHRKKFRMLLIQRRRITLTPITILSLVSKVFPNKKNRHNQFSSRSCVLLLRRSTACSSPPRSAANYFRDESSSIRATKRSHTRAYAVIHTYAYTYVRFYVGARLEVTVRSATREASLFSNALVNWPIAGSSPPTSNHSLVSLSLSLSLSFTCSLFLSLSLCSPLPTVNRGRNNLMIGSRFAWNQGLLRGHGSRDLPFDLLLLLFLRRTFHTLPGHRIIHRTYNLVHKRTFTCSFPRKMTLDF